jgi:hypothetical protein
MMMDVNISKLGLSAGDDWLESTLWQRFQTENVLTGSLNPYINMQIIKWIKILTVPLWLHRLWTEIDISVGSLDCVRTG